MGDVRPILQGEESKKPVTLPFSEETGGVPVAMRRRGLYIVAQGTFTGSATTVFTAVEDLEEFAALLTGNDGTDYTATMYLSNNSIAAAVGNMLFFTLPLPVGQPYLFAPGVGLRRGQALSGLGSTNAKVTYHIFGRAAR